MNINKRLPAVLFILIITVLFAACPTAYLNLPTLDDFLTNMIEGKLGGKIIAVMEAENGELVHLGPWGSPVILRNSGVASGGAYVKEMSLYHGYVEVTVPDTVQAGAYSLALGWSGSSTGLVTVTVNAGKIDEQIIKMNFNRNGEDWDMKDPQYLTVTAGTSFKPGDKIRVHSGFAGESGTPQSYSGGHINLDAVYLFVPDETE